MANKHAEEVSLKSTKQEILEAYENIKKELEEKEEQSLNAGKIIREKENLETVKKSDKLIEEDINEKINLLKSGIINSLNELSAKLSWAETDYKNLKSSIEIKDNQLKEIYGIEHSALSLASLIEANNVKTVQLEKEYSDRKNILELEIDELKRKIEAERKSYEILAKEKENEFKIYWDRKREEFEYNFKRESEQKLNSLNDELNNLKRSMEEEREKFQKDVMEKNKTLDERESRLSEKEQINAELAEKAAAFPAKLESEVSASVKSTTEKLKSGFALEKELIHKEYEGKVNVLNTKIESLEKIIEGQNKHISVLTSQHEKAYMQVQQIATSAIQGNLDKNSQNRFEQILDKISKIQVSEK